MWTLCDVPPRGVRAPGGVYKDFAHLGLNLLRAHGIAARYVSGYLYATDGHAAGGAPLGTPTAERGVIAENASAEVDTHAWTEAPLPGPDALPGPEGLPAWVGIDPTNRGLVGPRHVKIGHGRHYADVPPIKGIYRGGAGSVLEARVTITLDQTPDPVASARE